jgi:hypothetical protein
LFREDVAPDYPNLELRRRPRYGLALLARGFFRRRTTIDGFMMRAQAADAKILRSTTSDL